MIKEVRDFYYNVQDMDRAIQFYTAALNMQKVYGHEYWTTMQMGSSHIGLAQ